MKVCVLQNKEGLFLSMSGTLTSDWFLASKFPESEREKRIKYASDEFTVVTYRIEKEN